MPPDPTPLARLLREAARRTKNEKVRQWLLALANHGEHSQSRSQKRQKSTHK
jgi:hypothetical protein